MRTEPVTDDADAEVRPQGKQPSGSSNRGQASRTSSNSSSSSADSSISSSDVELVVESLDVGCRPKNDRLKTFCPGEPYEIIDVVGEGAYCVVCSARNRATGDIFAIKKIRPFEHTMFSLRTLREIRLLKHFRHDNVIGVIDIIRPKAFDTFDCVYLVQELMETDMHRVIRSQKLSDDHCQYFIYQILRALKALHSVDVIHRDLKPSNLLLNSNCDLKICDFGLARLALIPPLNDKSYLTEYVVTRWYRAPEVMLTFKEYTKAIDVWAVGCILAEMISGKPIFPGNDYHHQLSLILQVLGTPTMASFCTINSPRARDYIRSLPVKARIPFKVLYPDANPLGKCVALRFGALSGSCWSC